MDGGSHFFPFDFQGPGHGDYQVFVGPGVNDLYDCSQVFPGFPYSENVLSQKTPMPTTQMQPPLTPSILPTRVARQPEVNGYGPVSDYHHHGHMPLTPGPDHVLLESPGMTTGSSGTPETKMSIQTTTPRLSPPDMEGISSHIPLLPEALFPPPTPLLPRRRRPRRPRPRPQLSPEEEESKREKFLERNRAAAGKCRNKRKSWMTDLEDTKLDLEERNARLRTEVSSLTNEISQVRALLMEHAGCKDARIDKWVENEAKRFVFGTGEEQSDSMSAGVAMTSTASHPRHDSISSLSGYNTANRNRMGSPAHQRSLSLTQSSSPALLESAPMTQTLPPNTQMLYRDPPSYDTGSRPMIISHDSGYMTSSTIQMEEATVMNNFHEIHDNLMGYEHLITHKLSQLPQPSYNMELTGEW